MTTYTTIATITEVKKDNKMCLKGIGKYTYEKEYKTKWIILEEDNQKVPKFLDENTEFNVDSKAEIQKTILAMAMINKKAMKLKIEETASRNKSEQPTFTIVSILNP